MLKNLISSLLEGKLQFCSEDFGDFSPMNEDDCTYPRHSHFFRELLIVLKGTSRFVLGDKCLLLSPGCYIPIPSGLSHSYGYRAEDTDFVHLWVYFFGDKISISPYIVQPDTEFQAPTVFYSQNHLVELLLWRWRKYAEKHATDWQEASLFFDGPVRSLLADILISGTLDKAASSQHSFLADRLKTHIESCNGCDSSLERLEKITGYSKYYIAHKFKEETGQPIGDYINSVRLTYARAARKQGKRLKEIAYELGFSSPASFWKWWNKHKN